MASTAHGEIQVYASFPRGVTLGADLNLDVDNWDWVLCLTLPLKTLGLLQFSHRPYKWIRYAIGIVVGAEGDLSSSSDLLNIVDYDAGLPTESAALYYYTSDDEKQRMFPVDPKIARTNGCVLTGMDELICDAVHLLARSKGDTYISTYTERRSRDPASGDLVQDIDSIQNSIFLNKLTHAVVGKHVAFLPTPNFAMDTSDIDPTAPQGEKRCTAHLFEPSKPSLLGGMGAPPSGTPLRIPDTPDWPPAILFDAVYASTVLYHFGTQTLKDVVTATWTDAFYPGGIVDRTHADYKSITDAKALSEKRIQKQGQERPRNELQATLREAREKAAEVERRHLRERIDTWNRQVLAS